MLPVARTKPDGGFGDLLDPRVDCACPAGDHPPAAATRRCDWVRRASTLRGRATSWRLRPARAIGRREAGFVRYHLRDHAIRSLAKTSFVDHVLGRADMLAIFDEVRRRRRRHGGGTGRLAGHCRAFGVFSGVAYVQNLSAKVALGNPANAHYQNEDLGRPGRGDSAENLEKLVNKWFLGLDRPDSTIGTDTYVYAEAKASLFPDAGVYRRSPKGTSATAISCRAWPRSPCTIAPPSRTCSSSMATARTRCDSTTAARRGTTSPFWTRICRPTTGANTFLPTTGSRWRTRPSPSGSPWPRRPTPRSTRRVGCGPTAKNTYASLDSGWPNHVFTQVTAVRAAGDLKLDKAAKLRSNSSPPIAAAACWPSFPEDTPTDPLIAGNHVYAVVSYDAKTRSVLVYNPWGIDNGSDKPGLAWLSWAYVAAKTGPLLVWSW